MTNEERKSNMVEFFGMIGKFVAVVMILRYGALIAENYFHFLPTEGFFFDIINYIGLYAPMVLMISVGLAAVWDKSDILKLVVLVLSAAIVIFSFFPDVWTTIINYTGLTAAN